MNRFDKYKDTHGSDYNYPKCVKKFLDKKYTEFLENYYPTNRQTWSFIGYFENYYNELMVNVIAYRWAEDGSIGKYVEHTKVLVACPKFDYRWSKDMYVTMYGYKVSRNYWVNGWAKVENTIFKVDDYRTIWLNEIDLPKYKYSCYDKLDRSISNYLRFYEQFPSTEKIIKTGFEDRIVMSKTINKMVIKEKPFLRFMVKNKYYINWDCSGYDSASIPMIVKSYKKKISLAKLVAEESLNKRILYISRDFYKNIYKKYPKIKSLVEKKSKSDALNYNSNLSLYVDYINACNELELDLSDSKVYNPREFQKMHNLRMDEVAAKRLCAKALEKEKDRKRRINEKIEYDLKVKAVAKKHINLEYESNDYKIILAKNIKDFYLESKGLKHCLYRMGYYKKMADGKDLILFVRKIDKLNDPFVTVEYSKQANSIIQSYGFKDSKPDDEVKSFLYEWVNNIKKNKRIATVTANA